MDELQREELTVVIPFDEKELEVREVCPEFPGFAPAFNYRNYPLSGKQAFYETFIDKKPTWFLTMNECLQFIPTCVPDNICRAIIMEAAPFNPFAEAGGKDMFGVEWVFVPTAMGSMEKEGVPHLLEDVNDWKTAITFPDVDSWDWEGAAARNKDFLNTDKAILTWMYTGWFERLISFMGFEEAAVALLDEDQEDAVKELMMALSEVYCDIIEHYVKYFDVDLFYIHDDWGSQLAPFFNFDIAQKFFVPAMKKVTDKCHELGRIAELHSCGCHGAVQIENLIAAGWDIWRPQGINNIEALWEKYGDKITLAPTMDPLPENATDAEKIAAVDAFVEKYCTTPGKPAIWNLDSSYMLDDVVAKELYLASRRAYAQWPE